MKKVLLITLVLIITLPVSVFGYDWNDLINDFIIIDNIKMNQIQKDAALQRIKLFLYKFSDEEINLQLHILITDNDFLKRIETIIKKIRPAFILNSNLNDENKAATNKDEQESSQETDTNSDNKKTSESDTTEDTTEDSNETQSDQDEMKNFISENYSSEDNEEESEDQDSSNENNESETTDNNNTVEEINFEDGYQLYKEGKYSESKEILLKIENNSPHYFEATMLLGDIYFREKDYLNSLKYYSIMLDLLKANNKYSNETIGFCYKRIGIVYLNLKNYDISINYLSLSFELIPYDNETLYYLGYTYYLKGLYHEALSYWSLGAKNGDKRCKDSYEWLKSKVK